MLDFWQNIRGEGVIMRILLVEDDRNIVLTLTQLLKTEGFEVVSTPTQNEAVALVRQYHFDLALLDISLAQGNGFGVCIAIHTTHPDIPVIFLTASDDEGSTVTGLDMGAVDYIAKPFRPKELLSRIRVALRKNRPHSNILAVGDLTCDLNTAQVKKRDQEIILSALEYRLLLAFMQAPKKLLTREYLRDVIWDSAGEYVEDNTLNVYIRRLREKIEDDPSCPTALVTVRGLGYKMVE